MNYCSGVIHKVLRASHVLSMSFPCGSLHGKLVIYIINEIFKTF
jgi:hypothetical protein